METISYEFIEEVKSIDKEFSIARLGKVSNKNILSDTLHGFRGHEFHYSQLESVSSDSQFAFNLDIGEGIKNHQDGLIQNNTLASYGHLYFDSSNYAEIFIKNCLNESRR